MQPDLSIEAFLALRNLFFDTYGKPKPFSLREKHNTQDDPLDELISVALEKLLNKTSKAICIKSPGPLINPDLVVLRPDLFRQSKRAELSNDTTIVIAIEVKKLERTSGGGVARSSGLDYNSTPPCATVRIYDSDNKFVDVRCFYLFICQESVEGKSDQFQLSALTLCDGSLLNMDFDYYLSIVGERTKQIGIGSYKDGFNRQRPMLVFANPLGAKDIDHKVTLILSENLPKAKIHNLELTYIIRRNTSEKLHKEFYCYQDKRDVALDGKVSMLTNPFPTPIRKEATTGRGRFKLKFTPLD